MPLRSEAPDEHRQRCWLPMVKHVTTNSSSENAIASSAAPMTDGRMSGSVTSRNVCVGEAPRSRAASRVREVERLESRVHGQDHEGQGDQDVSDGGIDQAGGWRQRAEEHRQGHPDDQHWYGRGQQATRQQRTAETLAHLDDPNENETPRVVRHDGCDGGKDDAVDDQRSSKWVGKGLVAYQSRV